MFVYAPELLFRGEWHQMILVTITAIIGIWSLASAMGGWLLGGPLAMPLRFVMAAGAGTLVFPGLMTDAIGLSLVVAGCAIQQRLRAKTGIAGS